MKHGWMKKTISLDQLLNTGNVAVPAVEIVSTPPEVETAEPVIPEKHRTRAWLKYAAAALCGALLMLAILLMLKQPKDTHSESTSKVKYEDISGASFGEPFDFTWFD